MPVKVDDGVAPPDWVSRGRIPSLDGLRAVSIILVTISHLIAVTGSPFPTSWRRIDRYGSTGVDVFFVISGFLITHLLLKEMGRGGTISLKGFYARRAFRILPAYLTLLATAWALNSMGLAYVDPDAWLPALTFTFNLVPWLDQRTIGQIWSLCVEEHFYLIWPAALLLAGRSRAPIVLLALIALAPMMRFWLWDRFGGDINEEFFTPTRLDTIAIGCLLAYFARDPRSWAVARRVQGRGDWLVLVGVLVVLISKELLSRSGKYNLGPGSAVEAAAIAMVIFAMVSDPTSRLGQLLNCRPMVAIGVLSYSLYLGQTFTFIGKSPEWPLGWSWGLPLTILYALCSYYLVERPFLAWKDRRSGRHSSLVLLEEAAKA